MTIETTTAAGTRDPFRGSMQEVSNTTSLHNAMAETGTDFEVQRWDLLAVNEAGMSPVSKHVGIVRTDTNDVISVVGGKYGVIQNSEAFAPIEYLMAEGFIDSISQAGWLEGGAKVFMLANLSGDCKIVGDTHKRKLLIATTHDGSGSTTARGWLERVHCTNQIPAIFSSEGSMHRIRHTSKAQTYLQDFRHAIMASIEQINRLEADIEQLNQRDIQSWHVNWFVESMFPTPSSAGKDESKYQAALTRNAHQRDTLEWLIYDAPTNANVRGKASSLFHAAVEYSDYYTKGKTNERILRGRDVDFKKRALVAAQGVL